MADDQATLGSFAEEETEAGDAGDGNAGTHDTTPEPESRAGDVSTEQAAETTAEAGSDSATDLVCPWCLATEDQFVEEGPTGLACGRCSAALPVEADWFRGREVVARRPMYETGD